MSSLSRSSLWALHTYLRPGVQQYSGKLQSRRAWAGALLLEPSSVDLGMPLTSVKLAIGRKFFREANLFCVKEESCSNARLTWPPMDKKPTNRVLGLGRGISPINVAVLTGHCAMERHDFCRGCRSAEEEETVIHFLCPPLATCRYRLFGSTILVSLTELSSIDVKYIAGFSARGSRILSGHPLALTNFFFSDLGELGQYRDCVPLWGHNGLLCVLK